MESGEFLVDRLVDLVAFGSSHILCIPHLEMFTNCCGFMCSVQASETPWYICYMTSKQAKKEKKSLAIFYVSLKLSKIGPRVDKPRIVCALHIVGTPGTVNLKGNKKKLVESPPGTMSYSSLHQNEHSACTSGQTGPVQEILTFSRRERPFTLLFRQDLSHFNYMVVSFWKYTHTHTQYLQTSVQVVFQHSH